MRLKDLSFFRKLGRWLGSSALLILLAATNGCEGLVSDHSADLSRARSHGPIRVLTLRHPLIYQDGRGPERRGFEQDLLQNFADQNGLSLRFIVKKNTEEILRALRNGEGDVAAARLTGLPRSPELLSGPAFEETGLSLFCRGFAPSTLNDLQNRRVLLSNRDDQDGLADRFRRLTPEAHLQQRPGRASSLIAAVIRQEADCALTERLEGRLAAKIHPSILEADAMAPARFVAWRVNSARLDLVHLMNFWWQKASRDDEVMRILDRHQSPWASLSRSDVHSFLRHRRELWPRYESAFREAAKTHQVDWMLAGAIAYQESHWNENARSHTGVRGIMQLTRETADHVGIEDRLDPLQSIWGGTWYVRYLSMRLPAGLEPQERLAFILAAYNSGTGHLRDAQKIAESRGLNPWSWHHLKQVYPLLEEPAIAADLEFGPARGRETIQFVERVRGFYHLWRTL